MCAKRSTREISSLSILFIFDLKMRNCYGFFFFCSVEICIIIIIMRSEYYVVVLFCEISRGITRCIFQMQKKNSVTSCIPDQESEKDQDTGHSERKNVTHLTLNPSNKRSLLMANPPI